MRGENDIREIRKLLKSYVTRLENKDAAARTTKEWRIVARVLDRGRRVKVTVGLPRQVPVHDVAAAAAAAAASRVLDRIFFFCYIGTIVVSLFTIFPRDGGEQERSLAAGTTTPPESDPSGGGGGGGGGDYVDVAVTAADLPLSYDDYGDIHYR